MLCWKAKFKLINITNMHIIWDFCMRPHPDFSNSIIPLLKKINSRQLGNALEKLRQKITCIFEKSRFPLWHGGRHRGREDQWAERYVLQIIGVWQETPHMAGTQYEKTPSTVVHRWMACGRQTDEWHVAGRQIILYWWSIYNYVPQVTSPRIVRRWTTKSLWPLLILSAHCLDQRDGLFPCNVSSSQSHAKQPKSNSPYTKKSHKN